VPVFYLVMDDGVEWTKARLRRLFGRPGGRASGAASGTTPVG